LGIKPPFYVFTPILGGQGDTGEVLIPPYTPLLGDIRNVLPPSDTMIWYKDKTPYIRDIGVM